MMTTTRTNSRHTTAAPRPVRTAAPLRPSGPRGRRAARPQRVMVVTDRMARLRDLLLIQGGYYFLTGIWPLLHMDSFLRLTGPKTDLWLVQMVAVLTVAVAVELLLQRVRAKRVAPLGSALGLMAALAFLGGDLVHVLRGTISPIYLADAGVQVLFIMAWARRHVPDPPWAITQPATNGITATPASMAPSLSNLRNPMISSTHPDLLQPDAPMLLRELRDAFDAHFVDLIAVAREQAPSADPRPGHDRSPMYHIDFPHGVLQVTAIYDAAQDRFTQLVARHADDAHQERPSFTISLFL